MQESLSRKYVETLISILQDTTKTYDYNNGIASEKDKETQDLLHELELGKLDYNKGNKLARELKKIRQARRMATDENRTLKYLYEYFNGKTILRDLRRLQQEIIKEEKKMDTRVYAPRVRDDLTFTDVHVVSSMKEAFKNSK